jgi:NAD(P)-dependent dehydrogenase (short-subunit alcohol dehydrogenase family)/acyl carrier protein
MSAFATTPAYLVVRKPPALTDEEAAAVPVAFLTAVYGLEYLARLRPGDTVLIHSATGGVGLAALQVARRNGAQVFATAGTPAKRELLRELGVRQVMDSRSLRFADEVMELTGGRGVDVVLNSLAGQALTRSLALLAPGGRFVEIGKQDIYANSHLGLGGLRHNRAFFAVDLERSFAEDPELIKTLFAMVTSGFEAGDFTALPVTSFPYAEAEAAFAYMAQARHTGKIVLRPDGTEAVAAAPAGPAIRGDATYLITGGLGALGLETARYLAGQGARHLVLAGRRPPSETASRAIAELTEAGVAVGVRAADVSRAADVTALIADIGVSMPPLAGVVHAAGILDDGFLLQLDEARFRAVAAPKSDAAWHLHQATLDLRLDFFVLYSSAAALLGSPGQANYAAANAALDALACYRRSLGLPALSIAWGPWSRIGLAAGTSLTAFGVASLTPEHGTAALGRLLLPGAGHAAVLPVDPAGLRAAADSGLLPGLLAGLLAPVADGRGAKRPGSTRVRQRLLAVEPGRRRAAILQEHCVAEAARVLKAEAASIDATAPLANLGFDSLMSLELRKRLEASLGIELSATVAWRYPTIERLVPHLAERMEVPLTVALPDAVALPPVGQHSAVAAADTDLEQLSDAELEALLVAKMTQMEEGL